VNVPSETVIVFSDAFFTSLVCGEPLEGLYEGKFDKTADLRDYEEYLGWQERWIMRYMVTKARMSRWIERAVFRRIATFTQF